MACRYRHWRESVKVGPYIVFASSLWGMEGHDIGMNQPDFGLYLDEGWGTVRANYSREIINWYDRRAVDVGVIDAMVKKIIGKCRSGKQVEIACVAGHGRTGTVLACLLVELEHLEPKTAINTLRERYCEMAVETRDQQQLVADYYAYRKQQ